MAAYPIITPGSPAVDITTSSSSLSYQMLINTLTFTTYRVKRMYIFASSFNQATVQFQYITVKSTGQRSSHNFSQEADFYQLLPVFDADVQDEDLILDNMSVVAIDLEPNAFIQMNFWTDSVNFGDRISGGIEPDKIKLLQPDTTIERLVNNNNEKKKNIRSFLALGALGLILFYVLKDE